jgi:sorbitol/mannitol transport system permease protein
LSVYAEIAVTTGGGEASSNLPFLIASIISLEGDVGTASAGGIVAVIVANIVAFFLVRIVGKNLEA